MAKIELMAGARYYDVADAARTEAMVRALLPEGCEITKEHRHGFGHNCDARDPLGRGVPWGGFAIEWTVER